MLPTLAETPLDEHERPVVDAFISRLRGELGDDLLAVWLYGSRARGERHEESDIDLLVITTDRERDQDRVWTLADSVSYEDLARRFVYLSAQTWDAKWLAGRREIRSFFAQEVDRDRIVLYGESL